MSPTRALPVVSLAIALLVPISSAAQGTVADYQRAMSLRENYQNLATGTIDTPRFVEATNRFYYRRTIRGGHEFVLIDAATQARTPAFDHAKLADALASARKRKVAATDLPFNTFTFVDGGKAIEFNLQAQGGPPQQGPGQGEPWRCTLDEYRCRPQERAGRGGRGGRGGGGLAGPVRPPFDINGGEPKKSPDERLEAIVSNYNIAIRETGKRELTLLSTDGSEGSYYDPGFDRVVAGLEADRRSTECGPAIRRFIHYVESSPEDQLQPKNSTMQYAKPGDVLDVEQPVIFNVDTKTQTLVDNALFPNAYDVSRLEWRKDSRAVTFEYNQRGHQVFRVIEVCHDRKAARRHQRRAEDLLLRYSGKKFRHDVADGKEVVWMSERDGWNHLYLYDGATGQVKNQITKGNWAVRSVVEGRRGETADLVQRERDVRPAQDPYFVHYYRINFDGTGLTPLTTADGEPRRDVLVRHDRTTSTPIRRVDLAPGRGAAAHAPTARW